MNPGDQAARWNGGIAAVGLSHWRTARVLWKREGVALIVNSTEPQLDLGPIPVRLPGSEEVLWGSRLDLARVRLENIPAQTDLYSWHDIVLVDGVPDGERTLSERKVPVFNVIQNLRPSGANKIELRFRPLNGDDVASLEQAASAKGWAFENFTANVRLLCNDCSHGSPCGEHTDDRLAKSDQTMALAAFVAKGELETFAGEWLRGHGY